METKNKMLLYDGSIELDIPARYRDISQLMAAQSYQCMFAGESETDDFLIVDLLQPIKEVDLHVEEILEMNNVEHPEVLSLEYTSPEFESGVKAFLAKYKGATKVGKVERQPKEPEWMCTHLYGKISRNDGVTRSLHMIIGVAKHELTDIVVSVFKESAVSKEAEEQIKQMLRNVKVLDPNIFSK